MGITGQGKEMLEAARKHEAAIVSFLRELIAIPAESGREGPRCARVLQEYEKLGFTASFDRLGNVVARLGQGPLKILMDGHIDCVGVGDPAAWEFDPFQGKFARGEVWGRGAVDELPAIACMAYGALLLRDRSLSPGSLSTSPPR